MSFLSVEFILPKYIYSLYHGCQVCYELISRRRCQACRFRTLALSSGGGLFKSPILQKSPPTSLFPGHTAQHRQIFLSTGSPLCRRGEHRRRRAHRLQCPPTGQSKLQGNRSVAMWLRPRQYCCRSLVSTVFVDIERSLIRGSLAIIPMASRASLSIKALTIEILSHIRSCSSFVDSSLRGCCCCGCCGRNVEGGWWMVRSHSHRLYQHRGQMVLRQVYSCHRHQH